jgi:TetR/AcrR family transcriptional repressor of nem operon
MARTRVYDRDDLLRHTTGLFWARGFAGVAIDDIVQATGVSRSSLYASFPDKTALFIATIEHYLATVTSANLQRLRQGDNAALAIRGFLLQLAGQRPERGARAHGCLLTNTAAELGSEPEAVANLVSKAFRRMERALALRLREAKRQGDLAEAVNATRFARQLVALIQGLRVMTRLGVGNQVLRDAVQSALAPLGAGKQTKRKRRKHEKGSASNQGAGPVRRHAVRQHLGAG